jgi:hypothetical protein
MTRVEVIGVLIFSDYEYLCEFGESSSAESCIQRSIEAYSIAVDCALKANMSADWRVNFSRQHGNALNELGIHYMNQAACHVSKPGKKTFF